MKREVIEIIWETAKLMAAGALMVIGFTAATFLMVG